MIGDGWRRPVGLVIGLILSLLIFRPPESFGIRPPDRAKPLEIRDKPLEIHHQDDGWAELPSVAVTPDYAYIAYDVREGYESHVYLARIPRGGGEEGLAEIRLDSDGQIEFGPSITIDEHGGLWATWSSWREGAWTIRQCVVVDMAASPEAVLAGPPGFSSQVTADSRDGETWFVWIAAEAGRWRIEYARRDREPKSLGTFYETTNPIGRADVCVINRDHAVVTWDEYVEDRFVVKMREWIKGVPQDVVGLTGEAYANSWDPHVVGSENNLLTVWHRVPGGSDRCQPALAVPGAVTLEHGIDRPDDDETWRVKAFVDGKGTTWIAWLTRLMYRRTKLYLRRVDEGGLSEVCRVEFPMRKNFINWFDAQWDGKLVFAWEYSGGIYLSEFSLPELADEGAVADTVAAEANTGAGSVLAPVPPGRLPYSTVLEGETLQVYFGDYHNHTSFSDGRAYPDMAMIFGRDIRGLDFLCVTDHDITVTPGEFAWNNKIADILTTSGEYACLHGYEPSKGWAQEGFGHWNMLFPGDGDVFQFEEGMTPRAIFAYAIEHDAVLIPHHVGKKFAPYDWDYFDETAEPVVEMCSVHGIFETYRGQEGKADMVEGKFVEDGLKRGYHFGFVAGSDFHNCFEAFEGEYGLTGAYAASLTPGGIYEALKQRRTFALTGGRTVVDFRCNGRFMGGEIEGAERLGFTCFATSLDSITAVEIIAGGEKVFEQAGGGLDASFEWETEAPDSETYYYLRVTTAKGDLAWSSPIWSRPSK